MINYWSVDRTNEPNGIITLKDSTLGIYAIELNKNDKDYKQHFNQQVKEIIALPHEAIIQAKSFVH